jgi:hypothetical protein
MRSGLLLILLVLLSGAAPAAASAATIELVYQRTDPAVPGDGKYITPTPPTDVYALQVSDPAGVANGILVDTGLRVRDTAGPSALGEGCAADIDGWVTCTPPVDGGHASRVVLGIDTGAGDDTVAIGAGSPGTPTVDLGPGDDRIDITSGPWTVRGGPGADVVHAAQLGPVPPLRADPGACCDVVWDGGPGPDRASGAAVVASYAGRAAPVRVTPDGIADDGEAGEGDDVGADVGVIVGGDAGDMLQAAAGPVAGGPGDDVIVGSDGARPLAVLEGGDGNDTIRGGAGRDELRGDAGDDVLDGGPGDDVLQDGRGADRVTGGDGDDRFEYHADAARDVLSGGPGKDALTAGPAAFLLAPMRISLDGVADDGPLGEGDDVTGDWEFVSVARGDLVGTDGPDGLEVTRSGTIDGRGGDDQLNGFADVTGGPGRDSITTGADWTAQPRKRRYVIDTRDGERDRIACFDRSIRLRHDRGDRLLGCSGPEVTVTAAPPAPILLRDGGGLSLTLRCYSGADCRGRIWLRAGARGSRPIGTATFETGGVRHLRVRLHRRSDGRGPCVKVRATVRLTLGGGGRRRVQDVALGRCSWS